MTKQFTVDDLGDLSVKLNELMNKNPEEALKFIPGLQILSSYSNSDPHKPIFIKQEDADTLRDLGLIIPDYAIGDQVNSITVNGNFNDVFETRYLSRNGSQRLFNKTLLNISLNPSSEQEYVNLLLDDFLKKEHEQFDNFSNEEIFKEVEKTKTKLKSIINQSIKEKFSLLRSVYDNFERINYTDLKKYTYLSDLTKEQYDSLIIKSKSSKERQKLMKALNKFTERFSTDEVLGNSLEYLLEGDNKKASKVFEKKANLINQYIDSINKGEQLEEIVFKTVLNSMHFELNDGFNEELLNQASNYLLKARFNLVKGSDPQIVKQLLKDELTNFDEVQVEFTYELLINKHFKDSIAQHINQLITKEASNEDNLSRVKTFIQKNKDSLFKGEYDRAINYFSKAIETKLNIEQEETIKYLNSIEQTGFMVSTLEELIQTKLNDQAIIEALFNDSKNGINLNSDYTLDVNGTNVTITKDELTLIKDEIDDKYSNLFNKTNLKISADRTLQRADIEVNGHKIQTQDEVVTYISGELSQYLTTSTPNPTPITPAANPTPITPAASPAPITTSYDRQDLEDRLSQYKNVKDDFDDAASKAVPAGITIPTINDLDENDIDITDPTDYSSAVQALDVVIGNYEKLTNALNEKILEGQRLLQDVVDIIDEYKNIESNYTN